jgi:hypothetical protein
MQWNFGVCAGIYDRISVMDSIDPELLLTKRRLAAAHI